MEFKVFSVFDSKLGVHKEGMQFNSRFVGDAKRAFQNAANNPKTEVCRFPDDFTLYEVATFDDETGRYTALEYPVNHGVASSFVVQGQGS